MKSLLYVRNPYLSLAERDGFLHIQLPYFGVELRCRPVIRALLDRFLDPAPITILRDAGVSEDIVLFLVNRFLLLPIDELPLLSRGLLVPSEKPLGEDTSWYDLQAGSPIGRTGLFRVPVAFDQESALPSGPGAAQVREHLSVLRGDAAAEIIDFEGRCRVRLGDLGLCDLGDVAYDEGRETLEHLGLRIRKIVRALLERNIFPITFGGDHSLTFYMLDEIFNVHGPVGVIQFDAHHDFYTLAHPAMNELNHANVFHHVRRRSELRVLLQLGLRDCFQPPAGTRPIRDKRVSYVSSRELRSMPPQDVFRGLPRDIPYYLTFDVDALDPTVAPETSAPVPGGLDYYHARELVRYAASTFKLAGADFVEIGNSPSGYNSAAAIVARLILVVLLARSRSRPLKEYVFEPGEMP